MGFADIFKIGEFKREIEQLKSEKQQLLNDNHSIHDKLTELGAMDYYKIKEATEQLEKDYFIKKENLESEHQKRVQEIQDDYQHTTSVLESNIKEKINENNKLQEQISKLHLEESKLAKNIKTQTNKLTRSKELVKAVDYALSNTLKAHIMAFIQYFKLCNEKEEEKGMKKKIIALLMALTLSASIIACGGKKLPDGMSQDTYDTGIKALEIMDKYNDADIDADEADKYM